MVPAATKPMPRAVSQIPTATQAAPAHVARRTTAQSAQSLNSSSVRLGSNIPPVLHDLGAGGQSQPGVPIVYPQGRTELACRELPRPTDLRNRPGRTRPYRPPEPTDQKVNHEDAPSVVPGVSAEQAFPESHSLRSEIRSGAGRLAGRKRPAATGRPRDDSHVLTRAHGSTWAALRSLPTLRSHHSIATTTGCSQAPVEDPGQPRSRIPYLPPPGPGRSTTVRDLSS